jgi:pilus assembly protein CpaB
MRNARALLMIGLALIAALLATVLAARWMQQRASGRVIEKIAVAAVDVPAGQRLAAQHVRMIEWPASERPAGTFNSASELEGRVLKSGLTPNEPVLESKLAAKGTTGGLSALIGKGRRAITVRVNDVVGVAGFALPGNYVDVIVNTRGEGAQGRDDNAISKIVLERILVLAVAQEASRDDTKPKVVNAVTLEVTPLEAEKIDLARSVGTLSLVLRNQIDFEGTGSAGVTKEGLMGTAAMARAAGSARDASLAASAPPATQLAPPAPPAPQPAAAPVSAAAPAASRTSERAPRPDASRDCVAAIVGNKEQRECF